jgi:Xaa-Pro aminopeptidase
MLHDMRLFKSREEIKTMSQAIAISARAHERAMRHCRPGMSEFQVEAELQYEFTRAGSRFPAYPSIVAGGANACVLHYVDNAAILKEGDLLLVDAGAEYDYYASDITRTFPGASAASSASCTRSYWPPSLQPSRRSSQATTGTTRTRRRCA